MERWGDEGAREGWGAGWRGKKGEKGGGGHEQRVAGYVRDDKHTHILDIVHVLSWCTLQDGKLAGSRLSKNQRSIARSIDRSFLRACLLAWMMPSLTTQ